MAYNYVDTGKGLYVAVSKGACASAGPDGRSCEHPADHEGTCQAGRYTWVTPAPTDLTAAPGIAILEELTMEPTNAELMLTEVTMLIGQVEARMGDITADGSGVSAGAITPLLDSLDRVRAAVTAIPVSVPA